MPGTLFRDDSSVTEGLRNLVKPVGIAAGVTGAAMWIVSTRSYDPWNLMVVGTGLGGMSVVSHYASKGLDAATRFFKEPATSFKDAVDKIDGERMQAAPKERRGPDLSDYGY